MSSDKSSKETKSELPIFRDLDPDDENPEITEIESLCLQCRENGTTKILLTKIPFYKEVVVMSFSCPHCLWENNELQPATTIQEKGVLFTLKVQDKEDLSRQIVRTRWASVVIPEIDFEIPSQSQEGTITTIEGIIDRTCCGLSLKMEDLKIEDPTHSEKIKDFVSKFEKFKDGLQSFSFILRDCTGNSFIENLCAPNNDPKIEISHFERTREEDLLLGIFSGNDVSETDPLVPESDNQSLNNEVLCFPTNCYSCNAPCVTNMKVTQIPHFKEVIIMATTCDLCGHSTNEVKSGTGIEPHGVKITFTIDDMTDLTRDLLKSDTCAILIPEIELEIGPSALKGCYTTVEGILSNIRNMLKANNPLIYGDSSAPSVKEKMNVFLNKLDEVIAGTMKATLILDDPCGNSYLQTLEPPDPKEKLIVEQYKRSEEQEDELGLLHMKVENYEES